jgi:hypothetical protein
VLQQPLVLQPQQLLQPVQLQARLVLLGLPHRQQVLHLQVLK